MLELLAGERQPHESDKAVQACNDWLRVGSGRTVQALLEQYEKILKNPNPEEQDTAPTSSKGTLYTWHVKYDWPARASAYDATWEQRKNEEREKVFSQGLSLDFERVKRLVTLLETLEKELYHLDEKNRLDSVWLKDVKQIGSGEDAERIDIERFNQAIISEYRAVLDDIAKEVGGRIKKSDVTSGGDKIAFELSFKSGED